MALSQLTLYHDPTSEPSRAVHWFALEAGIELDVRLTWLTRGDHLRPEFLHINPAHQVPVLQHGALCLPESVAIMLYLAELHGCEERWLGDSATERAYTHRLLAWHQSNTRRTVTLDYALPCLLMPAYKGGELPPAGKLASLRDNLRASLTLLEGFLSGRGRFLGGATPSLADLFISTEIYILDCDPDVAETLQPFPAIEAWLGRLRDLDCYRPSHAAWEAVAARVRELLVSGDISPRDPGWVREICEPFFE